MRVVAATVRHRAAGEAGFTVVEGMVAALLLVLGALGALSIFDAGTRNTYRAEQSQAVNNRLQAELEAIRELPYEQIALTEAPIRVPSANDPRWRISSGATTFALNRDGTNPKALVLGGAVAPGPEPFTAGDVQGKVYRFVTWVDPNCPECGNAEGLVKRVVVAAVADAPAAGERAFQELHTDIVDPEAAPETNEPPDEDPEDGSSGSFWLTDTPCSSSQRIPPAADHVAHNTRGQCSDGAKSGETRGAPDLMFTEAPSVEDSPTNELFDYATDSNFAPIGNDDGLMMQRSTAGSCLLQPVLNLVNVKKLLEGLLAALDLSAPPAVLDGVLELTDGLTNQHQRKHTWLSPKIANQNGVVLTGRGTLELFTRSVNGAVHSGEICAWMFVRQTVAVPACLLRLLGVCVTLSAPVDVVVDIPLVNVGLLAGGECRTGLGLNLTNFQYAQNPWPTQWEKISLPMCFVAVNSAGLPIPTLLPKNSRLGMTMMVKNGGPPDALEFMYDAVGYESRLEVQTQDLIAFE